MSPDVQISQYDGYLRILSRVGHAVTLDCIHMELVGSILEVAHKVSCPCCIREVATYCFGKQDSPEELKLSSWTQLVPCHRV